MKYISIFLLYIWTCHAFAGTVIINPDNALRFSSDADSKSFIRRVFLGKVKSFPDGGTIVPVALRKGSPGTQKFNEQVLNLSESQVGAYWAKKIFTGKGTPPKELASDEEVIKLVASNPNLVGYIEGSGDESVKKVLTF